MFANIYQHLRLLSDNSPQTLQQGTLALFHALQEKYLFSLDKLRAIVFSAGYELQSYFPARVLREKGYPQLSMLSVVDQTQSLQLSATAYIEKEQPLQALRAAVPIDRSVDRLTNELLSELLQHNSLSLRQCHGLWLTTTAETDCAEALQVIPRGLRLLGHGQELSVPEAPRNILRMLLLAKAQEGISPRHVYLREAKLLRPDLQTEG